MRSFSEFSSHMLFMVSFSLCVFFQVEKQFEREKLKHDERKRKWDETGALILRESVKVPNMNYFCDSIVIKAIFGILRALEIRCGVSVLNLLHCTKPNFSVKNMFEGKRKKANERQRQRENTMRPRNVKNKNKSEKREHER